MPRLVMGSAMIGHEVAVGSGLALWGIGFTALLVRYERSDEVREQTARSRWRFDRRFDRRARHMGRDEWVRVYSRSQKRLVKWFGIPFAALWTVLAIGMLLHGLIG